MAMLQQRLPKEWGAVKLGMARLLVETASNLREHVVRV